MQLPTLDQFLKTPVWPPTRSWVREPGFDGLYVRRTQRRFEGKEHEVLDLANATVRRPGKGVFTKLVRRLQEQYPRMCLYAENVQIPRFATTLVNRLGFKPDPNVVNCFYLLGRDGVKEKGMKTRKELEQEISFMKEFMQRTHVECPECAGTGGVAKAKDCKFCKGAGELSAYKLYKKEG